MEPELNQQQLLQSRVLLIAPSLSLYRGYFQLPKNGVAVTIDDNVVSSDSLTTSRVILFNKDFPVDRQGRPWKKIFQNIASREQALVNRYSIPFPLHGVRIIPKSKGIEFLDQLFGLTLGTARRKLAAARENNDMQLQIAMERIVDSAMSSNPYAENITPLHDPRLAADEQSIARDLHVAAEEFCADIEGIYRQVEQRIDPIVWAAIQSKLPRDPRKLRRKFGLDITPVELAGSIAGSVTAEDLSEHAEIVREACKRRVEAAVDELVRGPRDELAAALANLQQLISDDGRVTARSFGPVRDAIAKVRLFDFVADAELLQQIKVIETRLDRTIPGDLNSNTAAANGFSAALKSVMDEVSSEESYRRGVEEFGSSAARTLDLD